jgi:hypothetical protein
VSTSGPKQGGRENASGDFARFLWMLALSACLGAIGPDRAEARAPITSGDTLTVLFTAETRGNLTPCTCPTKPLGGLARRVRLMADEAARHAAGGTVLRLDAGGFLPEGEIPLRAVPGATARLVSVILEGFARAGVQALALDYQEDAYLRRQAPDQAAALGPALLRADPPAPPRLLRWGTDDVAVLALEESLPDSSIVRASAAAREMADMVIVLARADAVSGRRLARLSRAELVILSRGARPVAPLREGPSFLVGCGADGREAGEVRLVWAGRALSDPLPADGSRSRIHLTEFRLWSLSPNLPEDRAMAAEVRQLMDEAGPRPRALVGVSE